MGWTFSRPVQWLRGSAKTRRKAKCTSKLTVLRTKANLWVSKK